MLACTLAILHNGCWVSEACKSYANIQINVLPYGLTRDYYEVWCQIQTTDGSPLSDELERAVRTDIRKHPSIDEFGLPDKNSPKGVYQVKIQDKGYSIGAMRILSRVEGTHFYPMIVMPVKQSDGKVLEYINFFVDNSEVIDKCKSALAQDKNITIVNEKCVSIATNEEEKWSIHPNFFNTFVHLDNADSDLIFRALNPQNINLMQQLSEGTTFLDRIRKYGPLCFKFVVRLISGFDTLKEVYDLIDKLRKPKP